MLLKWEAGDEAVIALWTKDEWLGVRRVRDQL